MICEVNKVLKKIYHFSSSIRLNDVLIFRKIYYIKELPKKLKKSLKNQHLRINHPRTQSMTKSTMENFLYFPPPSNSNICLSSMKYWHECRKVPLFGIKNQQTLSKRLFLLHNLYRGALSFSSKINFKYVCEYSHVFPSPKKSPSKKIFEPHTQLQFL